MVEVATESSLLTQQTMELTGENSDATLNNLIVAGDTDVYNLGIAGTLTTGFITIDGIAGSISTVIEPLQLQAHVLAGNVEIFNRKIVMTSDGSIEIAGILRAKEVETETVRAEMAVLGRLTIATQSGEITDDGLQITEEATRSSVISDLSSTEGAEVFSPSIGRGRIVAGEVGVYVESTGVSEASNIFVTPVGSMGGQSVYVEEILEGIGFSVQIDRAVYKDIEFSWWVIN